MKKVLFLMVLLFLFLGTAGVKAQVRIGGNTPPNPAAALDLNAAEGTTTGTKGLALPRVSLVSSTATLDGTTANINGMLVYNTGGTLNAGIYFWNGIWNRVDDAIGNEITDTIANGGLTRSGTGTAIDPYKVGIKVSGVTNNMIADNSVTSNKIATGSVSLRQTTIAEFRSVGTVGALSTAYAFATLPSGCTNDNWWILPAASGAITTVLSADGLSIVVWNTSNFACSYSIRLFCWL